MENITLLTFALMPERKCKIQITRVLIILSLVLTCLSTSMAQSYVSAPNEKSAQINLDKLTKKAGSGDTQSQLQLGFAYQVGRGVAQNLNEAIRWYRMAANSGNPTAQNN